MIRSTLNQRLQDLADNVNKDIKLLKEFEDVLRYETNPRVKAGYRQDIEQLRESATGYQQEYDELQKQIAAGEPLAKMQTLESQLHQMDSKLNLLLSGQNAISQNINQMQQSLLNRYDAAEKVMIVSIVEQLTQSQLAVTQTLLDALEANQLSEPEIYQMLAVLEERIPSLPPSQAAIAEIIKAPELDAKHKLKVTLPIVPFLIDYEGELELGSGLNIKSAWENLVSKLRKK
ncbi:hypothetical protein [Calothrix sp. PCC 7507]|uniref:hypothetical protein n=1 Tax=Calothrix sp. PCC 7507 TaxID=99598 RepID=UPI00029EC94A|nr:hypothetical protein [Calothrix sp. PCC 7507]AFY35565.1 hypothetical protein Cal7507_5224 [Calothrix sp. PCC 7507]